MDQQLKVYRITTSAYIIHDEYKFPMDFRCVNYLKTFAYLLINSGKTICGP